jgi:hypothetical protein
VMKIWPTGWPRRWSMRWSCAAAAASPSRFEHDCVSMPDRKTVREMATALLCSVVCWEHDAHIA